MPGADRRDEVLGGGIGTVHGTVTWSGATRIGLGPNFPGTNGDDMLSYPFSTRLNAVGTDFTVLIFAHPNLAIATDPAYLFTAPRSGSWTMRIRHEGWPDQKTNIGITTGGSYVEYSTAANFLDNNVFGMYGFGRQGDSLTFWKNGLLHSTATGVGTNPLQWGTERLVIGNHISPSGGFWQYYGSIPYVAIWNRKLTEDEVRQVYQNPYAFFEAPSWRLLGVAATVAASLTATAAGVSTSAAGAATFQAQAGLTATAAGVSTSQAGAALLLAQAKLTALSAGVSTSQAGAAAFQAAAVLLATAAGASTSLAPPGILAGGAPGTITALQPGVSTSAAGAAVFLAAARLVATTAGVSTSAAQAALLTAAARLLATAAGASTSTAPPGLLIGAQGLLATSPGASISAAPAATFLAAARLIATLPGISWSEAGAATMAEYIPSWEHGGLFSPGIAGAPTGLTGSLTAGARAALVARGIARKAGMKTGLDA